MKHITAITYYVPIEVSDVAEALKSVESYRDYVDRYIVIENGAGVDASFIREFADVYVMNKVNKLMAGAVNEGYMLASAFKDCEYLMFIDSGTRVIDGLDIEALQTDGVASPHIGNQDAGYKAHASMFVCHRDTFEKVGLWDSNCGNAADDVWFRRAVNLGIPMYQTADVVGHEHVGNTTNRVKHFNLPVELI